MKTVLRKPKADSLGRIILAENPDNMQKAVIAKKTWRTFEEVSFQNLKTRIEDAKVARTKGLAASIASMTLGLTLLASSSDELGPEILHKPREIFMDHAASESMVRRAGNEIQASLSEPSIKTDYILPARSIVIRQEDVKQDVDNEVSEWDVHVQAGGGALLALAAGAFSFAARKQQKLHEMENRLHQASSRFRTEEGFFWPPNRK